jgi:dCMP deaminase
MRPSNEEYFLEIAKVVSKRSTCSRRAVGCVLVNGSSHIIATAYNAVPRGVEHCIESACPGAAFKSGEGLHNCIAQHAETLALIRCPNINDIHTCYVTVSPCIECTRRLIDTSCRRIVFMEPYPHDEARELWLSYGGWWIQHPLEQM